MVKINDEAQLLISLLQREINACEESRKLQETNKVGQFLDSERILLRSFNHSWSNSSIATSNIVDNFYIREAITTRDFDAARGLIEAFNDEVEREQPQRRINIKNHCTEIPSSSPDFSVFLSFQNPEANALHSATGPIGCIVLQRKVKDKSGMLVSEGIMRSLYCEPEYRGIGVGKALVGELIQVAQCKYATIVAALRPEMTAALMLLSRVYGFENVGKTTGRKGDIRLRRRFETESEQVL